MAVKLQYDRQVYTRLFEELRREKKFAEDTIPYTSYALIQEINKNILYHPTDQIAVLFTVEWAFERRLAGYPKNQVTVLVHKHCETTERLCAMIDVKYMVVSTEKEWEKMKKKFDVVIGNPPYQDGRDKLFYQKFVNRAYDMSTGAVAMITPAGWSSVADLKTQFTRRIISNISQFCYLGDNTFDKVQLQLCYFVASQNANNNKIIIRTSADSTTILREDFLFFPTKSVKSISIISKIKDKACGGLHSTSGKLTRNKAPISKKGYKCIFTAGRKGEDFDWCWVSNPEGLFGLGMHKVIVTHATSIGNLGEVKYAGPDYGVGMACHAFVVPNKTEANNLINYLQSNVVRFIVKILKGSVASNSHSLFSNIPRVDLKRKWTDKELYKHFNLTKEEIAYIEATVK